MDAKEIKSALKSAREAIREKNYKEALKHCKAILKADKNNYNALVFIGVAAEGLDQPDQALMAFKKATEINSDQLLAWQGLCGFYEKAGKPEYSDDLIDVYNKLIELQKSDISKCNQIKKKLAQLLEVKGESKKCLDIYSTLLDDVKDGVERKEVLQQFIDVCKKSTNLLTDEQRNKLVSLHKEVSDNSFDIDTWTAYLKLLVKIKVEVTNLLLAAESFSKLHPDANYPLELQAKILLDQATQDKSTHATKLADVLEKLRTLKPESGYVSLITGMQALLGGNLTEAKQHLNQGIGRVKTCVGGWFFLTEVSLKTHDKNHTYKAATEGIHLLSNGSVCFCDVDNTKEKLQKWLVEACIQFEDEPHLNEATSITEKLLAASNDVDEVYMLQTKISIALKQYDEAFLALQKVKNDKSVMYLTLKGLLHHLISDNDQARRCLSAALALCEEYILAHYYMARVLFDDKPSTPDTLKLILTHLLKAAKLDPFWSEAFLYLGFYYRDFLNDLKKSVRCLQKAYDLDPDSEEIGSALIDGLLANGEENKALSVLKSVTSQAKAGSAKWAWLRLGLYQMRSDDPTAAIISLQSALRADHKDFHCWECLGEAYMKRGSYTAALKAFTRATELDSSALYCYYQMATIKQVLGLFDEAIVAYKNILETSSYVPALKGLGETYLLMARAALKECFHGRAVDYCEQALYVLTNAASQRADLSCVWKLLGDACITIAPLPEDKLRLFIPSKLISQSESIDSKVKVNKRDLLVVGSRCYGMAVKLQPECGDYWQDLGISYFYQSKFTDKMRVKSFINKSIQCLQKAIKLNPNNFRHWNTLGVLAASDDVGHPGLAQHCFIKSIYAESNNVTAWTNLGVLYLKSGEIKLAHEAFKVAQSLDPSYVACWIGQALIAETIQDEEAMDLFRHTTELGNHVEGAIGYGHWVCLILQDPDRLSPSAFSYAIKRMAAIPAASDALAKYVDRVHDDYIAYNMYGLLLERQGLLSLACEAFQKAVNLVEKGNDHEKTESIRTNYARLLCAAARATESIEEYQKLQSLDTTDRLVGLALAQCKGGQFMESINTYQQALALTDCVDEQSHIHTAIGLVAYMMGDLDAAKHALLAGSQLEKPSLMGLKALLAIGLIQKDGTLCSAVLQEFNKQSNADLDPVIHRLSAAVDVLNGTPHKSNIPLQQAIHSHPNSESLWLEEAEHLLQSDINQATIAQRCASKSLALGIDGTRDIMESDSKAQVSMQKKAVLLALSSLGAGQHCSKKFRNALNQAMKAVFIQPDSLEAWFVLLGAIYSEHKIVRNSALHGIMLSLTTQLMSRVESALSHVTGSKSRLQSLHVWCVKQYIVALLECGRAQQAQQFLEQAAWLYDQDVHLQALVAAFSQNFSGLKHLMANDMTSFTNQLLISLYGRHGLMREQEKTYQQWLRTATTTSQKLSCLQQMAYLAFSKLMSDGTDKDRWKVMFKKACEQGLELDPKSSILWLMQGLVALNDNKLARFAMRSLRQVLNCSKSQIPFAAKLAQQHLLQLYADKGETDAIKELEALEF